MKGKNNAMNKNPEVDKYLLKKTRPMNEEIQQIRKLLGLLLITYLTSFCTYSQRSPDPNQELSQEQQAAFDALNRLQRSTDEMNRLYSTFPNIEHPCFPADTSFEISQSELRSYMHQFITKNCTILKPEIQKQLSELSVLAQEKYTVLHCQENRSETDNENGIPTTGTWVLPGILNQRDLVLVW